MASSRQSERMSSQLAEEVTRKAADDASRVTHAAADASKVAAQAGADAIRRNAETMQNAWETGGKTMSQLTERSVEGFARMFGFGGDSVHQSAELSSRNLQCLVHSGTVIATGFQGISQELFDLSRKRLEQNVQRLSALAGCRTPHEFLAIQSELMRDNLEHVLQSTRRIAEISMHMADDAARTMNEASLAPR
jgi:phasin family protein